MFADGMSENAKRDGKTPHTHLIVRSAFYMLSYLCHSERLLQIHGMVVKILLEHSTIIYTFCFFFIEAETC